MKKKDKALAKPLVQVVHPVEHPAESINGTPNGGMKVALTGSMKGTLIPAVRPPCPAPDALTSVMKRPALHEVMPLEEQRDFARKSIDKIREMQGATLVKYWTDRNGLVSDERQVADNATQLAAAKAGIDIMGLAPSKFADTKGSQVIIVNIVERDQPNRPTNVIDIEAKSAD